jgi:hypothetical protein
MRPSHLIALGMFLAGCSSPTPRTIGDGSVDAGHDARAIDANVDAPSIDSATDAGPPPPDMGVDAPSPCGNGMGLHCGATIGFDPNHLYTCHDGMLMDAQDCMAPCIVHTDGSPDSCPCPNGDGTYCGSRVPGGDAHVIYTCSGGHYAAQHRCGATCTGGSAASDACPACPFGDGAYCGGPLGAEAYVLYNCANGVATPQATCQDTCHTNPPGVPDACTACQYGNGTYCGSSAHGDPNTLYNCANGVITPAMVCAGTCHASPPGVPDFCPGTCSGGLVCGHVQWWNTGITYGPYQITNGGQTWWDTDLAVGDRTPVQLRHDSVLLQAPVEPWGWQPRFRDTVTGETFQFLHLHPDAQYTTTVGMTYCAGTVVGLSGGGDYATGCCLPGRYSSGPHLCVETLAQWRTAFPSGTDACH